MMTETGMRAIQYERRSHLHLMAHQFVRYKGRLPENGEELVAWLLEFDETKNRMIEEWERIFQEHMRTCLHPVIIPTI